MDDVVPDAAAIPQLAGFPSEPVYADAFPHVANPRREWPDAAEEWLGRAAICWLSISLPLLATDRPLLDSVKLALPVAVIWFLVSVTVEQSSPERRPAFGPVARVFWRVAIGLAGAAALSAMVQGAVPRFPMLLVGGAAAATVGVPWELLVARARKRAVTVLVVGGTPRALAVARLLTASDARCNPIGVVCDEIFEADPGHLTVLGGLDDLADVVHEKHPRVVAVDAATVSDRVFGALAQVVDEEVGIVALEELHEFLLGQLPVRHVDKTWLMSALHLYRRPYGRLTKRAFDVVVATVGLVLAAPLMLVVALVLKRSGPVLYRQTRQGQGNAPFTILKFRTMRPDAEHDGRPVWAAAQDPRVTRVGRVLRRTRIDELPQLWNVLTGSMSVVGPRPERPEYFDTLSDMLPLWSLRTLLKPGITGWAQINSGYAADLAGAESKLSYDLWYLRHRSLLVDAAICVRTLSRMTAGSR